MGAGHSPPPRSSWASLRESNGHLQKQHSPASFHTAGRIEGRALSLQWKERHNPKCGRPTKTKTFAQTKQNAQTVVTHLTSRHAEKTKKRGTRCECGHMSCLLVATNHQTKVVGADLRQHFPTCALSLVWEGGQPLGGLASRRRTTLFCGVGGQAHCGRADGFANKQPAVLLGSAGGG